MKMFFKPAILITGLTILTACSFNMGQHSAENTEIKPHQYAGSEARKQWCRTRHTHTQKDYYDCVKGYGGQHSQYSIGVIHDEQGQDENSQ